MEIKDTNYRSEQEQFDKIKWYDSIREGKDMCGTYRFCSYCRKDSSDPCARAAHRYQNKFTRVAILRPRKSR
jgi:hypothetical protein